MIILPLTMTMICIYLFCLITDAVTGYWGNKQMEKKEKLRLERSKLEFSEKTSIPYLPSTNIRSIHPDTPLDKFLEQFGKQIGIHFAERTSFEIPIEVCQQCKNELMEWLQRKDVVETVSIDTGKIEVIIK